MRSQLAYDLPLQYNYSPKLVVPSKNAFTTTNATFGEN